MHTLKLNSHRSCQGIALVEVMTAAAVAVILFGGMLITLMEQQRTFISALYEMDAQGDESRVQAYLSRDLRQATSMQISTDGSEVTLAIPSTSAAFTLNSNLGLPLLSLLSTSSTGSATTTVSYYREGTSVVRDVGGAETQLSSSATQFQVSRNGTLAWTDMAFQPAFSQGVSAAPVPVNSCVCLLNSPGL